MITACSQDVVEEQTILNNTESTGNPATGNRSFKFSTSHHWGLLGGAIPSKHVYLEFE